MSARRVDVTPVAVAAGDGTTLRTLHVSASPARARGTVLIRTPYDASRLVSEASSWARAGYHAYVQDVRGRHGSGGRWIPYEHEGPDGADTVRALATAGRVHGPLLLSGSSYGAYAALEATRVLTRTGGPRPAGIVAMVPALGLWDTAHAPDGTPRVRDRLGWWLQHGCGRVSGPAVPPAALDLLCARAEQGGVRSVLDDLPPEILAVLPRSAAATAQADLPVLWRRLWDAPRPDPVARWSPMNLPLLVVTGDDDFFAEDARLLAGSWPGPASLVTGGWGHGMGTELAQDHPVRAALRTWGGLMPVVTAWAEAAAAYHPTTLQARRLQAWLRLDPRSGWIPTSPRRAA
ncbi:CocE/NonD family hydrolase [Arsenicicoccus dermatophilus]|uniref:CocE/NonD family hydrolase n=1 Tax=Arsenicicoccus dermatophilus TaxID=1076331 RepID=UPI001F4C75D0|nr:CocE/NonD family hydrolase [Arsenicicoccus dermatophilus]MCH8614377.1 hypothetical protein [Arsenicicoccus dermatophilus]MCH8614424.1 hypothetical protein [Arsenicicoccus dermatophilus]